jgi:threonine dehydratase
MVQSGVKPDAIVLSVGAGGLLSGILMVVCGGVTVTVEQLRDWSSAKG